MGKLTVLHINIIGIVVALIVGAGLYFTIITSALDTKKKAEAERDAVAVEAAKLPQARRDLKQAQADKVKAEAEWRQYDQLYTPDLAYTNNRLTTMMRVFWPNGGKSWPERFIRTVNRHMAAEGKRNGVVWENPGVVVLPSYGPDPNTIDAGMQGEGLFPVLHYEYQFAVRARTLDKLMAHITSWPRIREAGIPVVSGLQVSGNSPNLRATYNVSLTVIVRNTAPPPNARISGSGGGGGAQPGGMGPMGGMTGPGGMMGPGMMGPRGAGSGGMSMGMGGGMAAAMSSGSGPPASGKQSMPAAGVSTMGGSAASRAD